MCYFVDFMLHNPQFLYLYMLDMTTRLYINININFIHEMSAILMTASLILLLYVEEHK